MRFFHKLCRLLRRSQARENQFLQPKQALFDGSRGIRILFSFPPDGNRRWTRFIIRRGKTLPSAHPNADFTEQFLWCYPDKQPPKLLWCNQLEEWYEVYFYSIQKP